MKRFMNSHSLIYDLLFGEYDQSRDPQLVLRSLRENSQYFHVYESYCRELRETGKT